MEIFSILSVNIQQITIELIRQLSDCTVTVSTTNKTDNVAVFSTIRYSYHGNEELPWLHTVTKVTYSYHNNTLKTHCSP